MASITCPACGATWESFAASSCTRCGSCGGAVYVPAHLRRTAPAPYRVTCTCGHAWRSTSASGRTRCRACGGRVYVPVADRGPVLRHARQIGPRASPTPAPRRVRVPRPYPPRAVAHAPEPEHDDEPEPVSAPSLVVSQAVTSGLDRLVRGLVARAGSAPGPAPEVRRMVPTVALPVVPRAAPRATVSGSRAGPTVRCPRCTTGIARCMLPGCPMPPG